MNNRRCFISALAVGTGSLLSGCGTILYPDRAYQEERGDLDPAIIILDGIGLFFFIIPGLVAFSVDLTTGAIYFPADHIQGDRERTIFDRQETNIKPTRQELERRVALKTGKNIDLTQDTVRVMELQSLDQFWAAHAKCIGGSLLAKL
jgi:hypothetical protein